MGGPVGTGRTQRGQQDPPRRSGAERDPSHRPQRPQRRGVDECETWIGGKPSDDRRSASLHDTENGHHGTTANPVAHHASEVNEQPLTNRRIGGRSAERVRQRVEGHTLEFEGQRFAVTVSVGVGSVAGADEFTVEELIAQADRRLYEAKRAGRNRVV